MPLVRTPRANRRGERDEGRPDPADHRRDGESQHGEAAAVSSATSSGPTMNVISCSDASSAYAAARRSASTNIRGHSARSDAPTGGIRAPAARRADGDGQRAAHRAARERRPPAGGPERSSARGSEDPRLAAPVDEPAGDRSSHRGRHEVRAGDRAGRRVAAAVLAHEQQQGQSDHPHAAAAQGVRSGRVA